MNSKIILNLFNIVIFLNIFSYYNYFALNIEILLFFIFIIILFILFFYLYNLLLNFLYLNKNEILKEYYINLFDFFNLISFLNFNLNKNKQILIKLFNLFKYSLNFLKLYYFFKINKLLNFFNYVYINILNVDHHFFLVLKKSILSFFIKIKNKNFVFINFYKNIFIKDLTKLNTINLNLIFFWLKNK